MGNLAARFRDLKPSSTGVEPANDSVVANRVANKPSDVANTTVANKPKRDRRAYQRDYMRKWRAAKK